MEQFSPQAAEIVKAIWQLPLEEQRKVAEEVLHWLEKQRLEEQNELPNREARRQGILALAGSWKYIAEDSTDDMLNELSQGRKEMFNRRSI